MMIDTKTKILDAAEALIQVNGFNGFSYLDLADEIGIKTASIHYHYKVKDDLAAALVERISEMHSTGLSEIKRNISAPIDRLIAVIDIFKSYVPEKKFCLCGMMALEMYSVSPKVRDLLINYFDNFQAWLAEQYEELNVNDPQQHAVSFISSLEGASLLARLRNEPEILNTTMMKLISA